MTPLGPPDPDVPTGRLGLMNGPFPDITWPALKSLPSICCRLGHVSKNEMVVPAQRTPLRATMEIPLGAAGNSKSLSHRLLENKGQYVWSWVSS